MGWLVICECINQDEWFKKSGIIFDATELCRQSWNIMSHNPSETNPEVYQQFISIIYFIIYLCNSGKRWYRHCVYYHQASRRWGAGVLALAVTGDICWRLTISFILWTNWNLTFTYCIDHVYGNAALCQNLTDVDWIEIRFSPIYFSFFEWRLTISFILKTNWNLTFSYCIYRVYWNAAVCQNLMKIEIKC